MERKHLSTVARQFKRSFSQQVLNGLGKAVRFCVRVREITPYRLALGLIEVFATMQVKTIADVHRAFNALCNTTVHYKPFHNQLVKATFPTFMRGLCEQLMAQLTSEVLRFAPQSAFAQFTHITIHDGTSFAVKSTLKKTFPGRFTKVSPAAVELHVSMERLSEGLETVTLTADKESEVHHAPAQNTLRGGLFLADRMFFIKRYLAEISAHGGYFIVKAKGVINPMIRQAHTHEGGAIKRFQNLPLKPVKSKVSKYRALDLDVAWEGELEARLIVTWDPKNKRPRYLVTNLPRAQFTLEQIWDAYRLRWQVGVSSQGHIVQSVEVRPRPKDSGLVAWEAPWRESKTAEPSDNMFRKEHAQRTRLQRAVNVEVASLHVIPVAETVYNARRQQGLDEMSPMRQPSPAGYQRRHGVKDGVSTGETRGARWGKPTEEASPITVSGKWRRRHPGGGSGRSTYDGRAAKRARREGPGPVSTPLVKVRQG
jgi:DDE family transposase